MNHFRWQYPMQPRPQPSAPPVQLKPPMPIQQPTPPVKIQPVAPEPAALQPEQSEPIKTSEAQSTAEHLPENVHAQMSEPMAPPSDASPLSVQVPAPQTQPSADFPSAPMTIDGQETEQTPIQQMPERDKSAETPTQPPAAPFPYARPVPPVRPRRPIRPPMQNPPFVPPIPQRPVQRPPMPPRPARPNRPMPFMQPPIAPFSSAQNGEYDENGSSGNLGTFPYGGTGTPADVPQTVFSDTTYDEFLQQYNKTGRLKIQAYAAQQAVPLTDVEVIVSRRFSDGVHEFFRGNTDQNGVIDNIVLPAPDREASLESGGRVNYASYDLYAQMAGLPPHRYEVQIFDGIETIQPITLRSMAL